MPTPMTNKEVAYCMRTVNLFINHFGLCLSEEEILWAFNQTATVEGAAKNC